MAFCFAWRPAYRGQEQQNLGINVTGVCPIFGLQQIHECSERPKKSGLVKSQLWSLALRSTSTSLSLNWEPPSLHSQLLCCRKFREKLCYPCLPGVGCSLRLGQSIDHILLANDRCRNRHVTPSKIYTNSFRGYNLYTVK